MSIARQDALPLFTYGTLLDPAFTASLLEHPVAAESATLLDHELVTLPGFAFQVVIAAQGASVRGRLYRHLSAEDFRRLDAYEGVGEGLYRRVIARITAGEATGPSEAAFVYAPSERTLGRVG